MRGPRACMCQWTTFECVPNEAAARSLALFWFDSSFLSSSPNVLCCFDTVIHRHSSPSKPPGTQTCACACLRAFIVPYIKSTRVEVKSFSIQGFLSCCSYEDADGRLVLFLSVNLVDIKYNFFFCPLSFATGAFRSFFIIFGPSSGKVRLGAQRKTALICNFLSNRAES